MIPSRRHHLSILAAGGIAPLGWPGAVFAAAPTDRRLVVVLLRGALDGLAAVPPLGDPRYAEKRGRLLIAAPGQPDGALPLDGFFSLHPALAPIHPYWRSGELLVVTATGNGYRTRSHFDAQDLMETGLSTKRQQTDGWLNRALGAMPGAERRMGLALGGAVPLILRGPTQVATWEPPGLPQAAPEFLATLAALYQKDAVLGPALTEGLRGQSQSDEVLGMGKPGVNGYGPKSFRPLAEAAGKLLAAETGPRVAVLDMLGWDTHVNQGAEKGRLADNLAGLAEGLDALAKSLGSVWGRTAVIAVTEFGRTVAVNGSGGTDHGTGSVAFLLGGAVRGGRIAGDWPGLDRLEDGRDLRVAVDTRSLLKGLLRDHMGLDAALLDRKVFPDSAGVSPAAGLVKA